MSMSCLQGRPIRRGAVGVDARPSIFLVYIGLSIYDPGIYRFVHLFSWYKLVCPSIFLVQTRILCAGLTYPTRCGRRRRTSIYFPGIYRFVHLFFWYKLVCPTINQCPYLSVICPFIRRFDLSDEVRSASTHGVTRKRKAGEDAKDDEPEAAWRVVPVCPSIFLVQIDMSIYFPDNIGISIYFPDTNPLVQFAYRRRRTGSRGSARRERTPRTTSLRPRGARYPSVHLFAWYIYIYRFVHLFSWYISVCPSIFLVQIDLSIYFPGTNWSDHLFFWYKSARPFRISASRGSGWRGAMSLRPRGAW